MDKIDYKAMGKRIREKRLQLGLTQENLAEKIEMSTSYIGEIERGTSIGSLAAVVSIARVLGLNLDSLINGINGENANQELSEILDSLPEEKKDLYIQICEGVAGKLK